MGHFIIPLEQTRYLPNRDALKTLLQRIFHREFAWEDIRVSMPCILKAGLFLAGLPVLLH